MSRLKWKILNNIIDLNYREKIKISTGTSRLLRKKVLASWKPVNIKGPELLQVLTDAMTYGATVRINYRNSGWRSILPYGWNSSKEGNTLIMCYKDTGEIRSYRLDRIFDLLINDDLNINHDESLSWEDFQMPTLPNINEIINETEAEIDEPLPYDEGLKALTTNQPNNNIQNNNQDGENLSEIDHLDTNESNTSIDDNTNSQDNDVSESDSSEDNTNNEHTSDNDSSEQESSKNDLSESNSLDNQLSQDESNNTTANNDIHESSNVDDNNLSNDINTESNSSDNISAENIEGEK